MEKLNIVIDTNVVVSALRSKQGASFKLISLIVDNLFEFSVSVPLVLEYESVLQRHLEEKLYSDTDINDFLNFLCKVGNKRKVYFLWRPFLKDPKDDMVLELAIEANCEYIVSFNKKDFVGISKFGKEVLTPSEFIKKLQEKK
jgi:putative PIN family toxin of toxin-antitoxin system